MDNQPNQQPDQPQPQYQPITAPVMPSQQQYVQPQMQQNQPSEKPGKVIAIIGFVMAFIGLGIVGIILSIIGLNKSKKAGHKNGLAIAGIILNIISIIFTALLVSITVISYIGVTAKANSSVAASNALSMQSCADMYYYTNGAYPDQALDFSNVGYSCSTELTNSLSATNGKTAVDYQYSGDYGQADGGKISYWDFTTGKENTYVYYLGYADETSTFHDVE